MNNILTKYLSMALDFLFLKQPTRSSLGLAFGMASRILIKILSIWVIVLQSVLANIDYFEFGLLGFCLAHIPTVRDYYSGKTNYLSENEEKAFSMINGLKITDFEKQKLYFKVVEKVLEKVELKPELEEEIRTTFYTGSTPTPN